jgi:hypothetical protein
MQVRIRRPKSPGMIALKRIRWFKYMIIMELCTKGKKMKAPRIESRKIDLILNRT